MQFFILNIQIGEKMLICTLQKNKCIYLKIYSINL